MDKMYIINKSLWILQNNREYKLYKGLNRARKNKIKIPITSQLKKTSLELKQGVNI